MTLGEVMFIIFLLFQCNSFNILNVLLLLSFCRESAYAESVTKTVRLVSESLAVS
jgi:hypothetical protein